ncbi:Nucleotide-binding universal stress protein, UspA family [Saccharopolyspora kobensis]|uniref:Nucleotide-binding universal stress protein, UspA family n=1 Tax=Saccharopolyspora kobensis TaxID=146035 RepID=A0A1H5VVL2_9PSEU|nr:universal stress protein [Saccharopolyspora kobensis]SEF90607.1 Nucleotide-binding universal stress protein, UspA family [Saccharopolyspora kobensis]SFC57099.1 Nucleotide-binding universal stress protein, UspA family [Saccharopolyspora kobensis]
MSGFGRVVTGVDGSAVALNAARWAAREAARRRSGLRIVYADPTTTPVLPELPGLHWPKEHREQVREQVAHCLDVAAGAAREQAPDLAVDAAACAGSPVLVLIDESRAADLVVVGDRGFGGFTGLLAGSVAVKIAAHAKCSVAVVPDTGDPLSFPVTGPVLAGIDDDLSADLVLAQAFAAAAHWDVPLHVVHTWEVVGLDLKWLRSRLPSDVVGDTAVRFVAEVLAGWSERYPDVEVLRFIGRGTPTTELLSRAREAQLAVVGARGRSGVAGAHLGSTSHKLLHHSPCPVLIVRAPEPAGSV